MNCKLAVQTIIWGERIRDWQSKLKWIASRGFKGVEVFQVPCFIGTPPERVEELETSIGQPEWFENLLTEQGLVLVGLSGGSLAKRMAFSDRLRTKPCYLYVDEWDAQAEHALKHGYTLAVHPHINKGVQKLNEAISLLDRHAELQLLPDTAHLVLAGADVLEILIKYKARLAGIHLKDWTHRFGWSRTTYARGFTELGNGSLDLQPIRDWIDKSFGGWVVLEQDFCENTPEESIDKSVSWFLTGTKKPNLSSERVLPSCPIAEVRSSRLVSCLESVPREAVRGLASLHDAIAQASHCLFDALCVTVWEVNPRTSRMTLASFSPFRGPFPRVRDMPLAKAISARAIRERIPCYTPDIPILARSGAFLDQELADLYHVYSMLSVPVPNLFNPNSPELLINAFLKNADLSITLDELESFSQYLAFVNHTTWTSTLARIFQEFNASANRNSTAQEVLQTYISYTTEILNCDAASIFLVNPDMDRLVLRATTGLDRDVRLSHVSYRKGEGLPGNTWQQEEILNLRNGAEQEGGDSLPKETTSPHESTTVILTPILRPGDKGDALGVIRARGKRGPWPLDMSFFTVSDEVLLDAVQSAMAPRVATLLGEENRDLAVTCIRHELKVPIGYTRSAIELLRTALTHLGNKIPPYLDDVDGYMDLMLGVIDKTSYTKAISSATINVKERVILGEEVVGPAVHQLRQLIEKYKQAYEFSAVDVSYTTVNALPKMFIDKPLFQQVAFNLIDNAVKYAKRDKEPLKIEIRGVQQVGRCLLVFRDYGIGIQKDLVSALFHLGVRGEMARQLDASGAGIGLWLSAHILTAHGATIEVTNRKDPTEFTIGLPDKLQTPNWNIPKKEE